MAEWVTRVSDIYAQMMLNDSEKQNNALCVLANLFDLGWSLEAICGTLGNIQIESYINPGACEGNRGIPTTGNLYYGGGLGLIQWTDYPAYSKRHVHPLLWYANQVNGNWYDGNLQCYLIDKADDSSITSCGEGVGPLWGWMRYLSYPYIPFSDYKVFTGSVDDATTYWYYCLERPSEYDTTLQTRKDYANYWYSYLQGEDPPIPTPTPTPPVYASGKKMPLWMMCRRPH